MNTQTAYWREHGTVTISNDIDERRFKLLTDFSQFLTKDELKRSRLLQGVDNSRRKYADFRRLPEQEEKRRAEGWAEEMSK